MNRRNFLKNSALALFGFSVLPPAKTYERIWKATIIPKTFIFNASAYQGEWRVTEQQSLFLSQEVLDAYKYQLRTFDPKFSGEWGLWTPEKVVDDSVIKA